MMTNTIRIMLVDDHNVVRSGLRTFLEAFPNLELVCEAQNGFQAVLLCQKHHPDVVLMDLVMPEMDGVSATRQICERFPETQVIAMTSFDEDDLVQGALQAGAISYLLKNISADDLAAAIQAAVEGKPVLAPEAARALIHTARKPAAPTFDFSEREQEVLAFMVKGFSNREIAGKLFLSPDTVKYHVSGILKKMGAANRAKAVALALKHNLVS